MNKCDICFEVKSTISPCTCKYNILVVASAMIEFAENDKLTVLPCAHEFHSACVETKSWGVPV